MIFFLIFTQNIDCEYILEPPGGGPNEHPGSMFQSIKKKKQITFETPVLLYKSGV